VRLAAAIPAIRAISKGLPLGSFSRRSARKTAGDIRTNPCASAVRSVTSFDVTLTIATSPRFRKCVSFFILRNQISNLKFQIEKQAIYFRRSRISFFAAMSRHTNQSIDRFQSCGTALNRSAARKNIHPFAGSNFGALGTYDQEPVRQK
jgi:hypothetical protein